MWVLVLVSHTAGLKLLSAARGRHVYLSIGVASSDRHPQASQNQNRLPNGQRHQRVCVPLAPLPHSFACCTASDPHSMHNHTKSVYDMTTARRQAAAVAAAHLAVALGQVLAGTRVPRLGVISVRVLIVAGGVLVGVPVLAAAAAVLVAGTILLLMALLALHVQQMTQARK